MRKLRVMTYNISHGAMHPTENIDLARIAHVLQDQNPDIIGLNEVYGRGDTDQWHTQAEKIAAMLEYHCYYGRSIWFWGKHPYGNAILSRWPIVEASVIPIPDPPVISPDYYFEPRSICRCVVEVPLEGEVTAFTCPTALLAVYVSHFGLSPEEKQQAADAVHRALRQEALPFVLMGDLNMEPDDPHIRSLAAAYPSADAYLDGVCTFPSDAPTLKLDHIYTAPTCRIAAAGVPQVVASDHLPVWADLELPIQQRP